MNKQRLSNLELFRIISMLGIIAAHYVNNSGLIDNNGSINTAPTSGHSIFLLLFGAWGKIGINCFVMITGYFMCKSRITAKKFAKLICEVLFYKLVFFTIFWLSGYSAFSLKNLITTLLPVSSIQQNFTGCFIVFFLFIPFLNALIQHLNERQHIRLLALCCFTYIVFGTIHGGSFGVTMNYVSWFIVLYFIASYIRLYPKAWFSNNRICGVMLLVFVLLSVISVVACVWLGTKLDKFIPFYFVTDSNTFLAVMVGVFAFLFFKNLRIPHSKLINTIAASTFGVLLIHANSDTMRQWLWKDTIDCVGHYGDRLMPLYAIGCVVGIFAICVVIDIIRINLLEKPFFKWWDKHWDGVCSWIIEKEKAFLDKMSIM